MPRVSILLTCFNHLQFLPIAYQSVLDQTFSDYEILAIDDGSADGSREWLKAREGGPTRCIFNEQNLGTYAALNVGLKEAKGEFVAILNDDDVWQPGKLALQVALLDSDAEIGMTHTSGWFIDDAGARHSNPAPFGFPFPNLPTGRVLGALIERNQVIASSVVARKSVLEEVGSFDSEFYGCGDWHMWLKIARKYKIGFVEQPLTLYRVHDTNAASNDERMFRDGVRIREWIAGWDLKDEALRPILAHNLACLGTERTWLGDAKGGRRAYAASIKLLPTRVKTYLRWLTTFLPQSSFRKSL